MFGLSDGSSRSSRMLAFVVAVVLLNCPAHVVLALKTTPGSPCTDVCGKTNNTTSSEIVCLDQMYNKTSVGRSFEECISCQLDSEFHDMNTGESDVNWGLYNLRYAFSTCVFGSPESISNVSSPCPVACDGVRPAVETHLEDPDTSNLNSWCETRSFADNVVNTCEFCYNLTSTQVYIANFLESIRYNCHFKTATGKPFKIAPTRIFTQSLLPSSLSLTTPGANHSNLNLGVVIAVPIVGFLILVTGLTACCFFFVRHRRRKVGRSHQSPQMYNRWHEASGASPTSPQLQQQAWTEQQMYNAGVYGHGSGFGFIDNDGRGQELAYGHAQNQHYQSQQYQQHYQSQDKSGVSQEITEQPDQQYQQQQYQQQLAQQQYQQQQQYAQVQDHPQVFDPDQKQKNPQW